MYRATEIQRACPRSQAWLLQAFEAAARSERSNSARGYLVSRRGQRQAQQAQSSAGNRFASTSSRPAHSQARAFSTSRCVRQDAREAMPFTTTGDSPAGATSTESIENIVRQAKATFGDTLPRDYLSSEEYKLYERLYGTPLRETHPDDIGIPSTADAADFAAEEDHRPPLFRETQSGFLEEVYYNLGRLSHETELQEQHAAGAADSPLAESPQPTKFTELAKADTDLPLTDRQLDYIQAVARNNREFVALTKLQRDFEAASLRAAEAAAEEDEAEVMDEVDEEVDEDLEADDLDALSGRPSNARLHPLTTAGHGRTSPSTVSLPRNDIILPVSALLKRTDISHVRQAAQKVFGGERLPYSPATPRAKTGKKGGKTKYEQKAVALEAGQRRMAEIDADAYIATVLPGVYATAMNTLVEVRKRLGSRWIESMLSKPDGSNPRILDVGGGGAALAAWNQVFRSDLELLRERGVIPRMAQSPLSELDEEWDAAEDGEPPADPADRRDHNEPGAPRKRMERTVVVGSDELRHRISRFMHNTTFLPRLPDLLHSAENVERHIDAPETPHPTKSKRKTYDVIIASHLLMPLEKTHQRRALVANLWAQLNPHGGVLIVLEKGHPRGFEAVADARQRILDDFIVPPPQSQRHAELTASDRMPEETPTDASEADAASGVYTSRREPGMIIAPCTSHGKCPMYLMPGLSPGRKDFCHFSQRFIRPVYLQKIIGESHRNHEDIEFSYVAVQRGTQPVGEVAEAEVDKEGPLVQGREAADAAFAGYGGEAEAESAGSAEEPDPHMLTLPRMIMAPLKRHGHVILDLCTPAGQLERWTVSKSFGKQAYHDARKSQWGDLWALGGKTRVQRTVRLGKSEDGSDKKKKPRVIELAVDPSGDVVGASERFRKERGKGIRVKGGYKNKALKKADRARNLLAELKAEGMDD